MLQQPVDHLVDRAVAAEGHDEVDPVGGGLRRPGPGRARGTGLDDVQLDFAGQGADQAVRIVAVVLVAAGLTTTSARMTVQASHAMPVSPRNPGGTSARPA